MYVLSNVFAVSNISSSSSSDDESSDSTSNVNGAEKPTQSHDSSPPMDIDNTIRHQEAPASDSKSPQEPESDARTTHQEEDFSQFYLRNVTAALADDLDKVRAASDFSDEKVGMLIRALKQGEEIFSEEEKRRIVGKRVVR